MIIPQTDPGASYQAQREKIDSAIQSVLDSGWYILGREVKDFEREFADYVGCAHAVSVGTGTDALFLALKACGVEPGDEVITVSHTAVATIAAIEQSGAVPVFVDIEEHSFNMDVLAVEQKITERTKAIMPVHLYGLPVDMTALSSLAQERGLKVVEDCAQAHGAAIRNTNSDWMQVGAFGDVAAFSFYPTKNLGALGDGGCIVTNDAEIFERAAKLRQYGWEDRYVSSVKGWNSRLDEIQAAILRVKLRKLDEDNESRRRIAAAYDELLANSSIMLPVCPENKRHVYHQYVIRLANRNEILERLREKGVHTAIHYPLPVHLQPAYQQLAGKGSLPVTEQISDDILSLPMYPQLEYSYVAQVAEELQTVMV